MPAIEFLTIPQAAERLQISTRTVRRAIAEGRLRGYRVGERLVRVSAAEVDAFARPIPTYRRGGGAA